MRFALTMGWLVLNPLLHLAVIAADEVALEAARVSGGVHCVLGQGGNTGVLATDDGVLVVDCKYESVADSLMTALRSISAKPITHVIATHYHADHTGGIRALVGNAELTMHSNCATTMRALLHAASGDVAFLDSVRPWADTTILNLGAERVRLLHFGRGHTTGDLVVVFETSKVVHSGDLFFNGRPPYMDTDDTPDTENWLRTIDTLCRDYPDYRFIPGHGEVADADVFLEFAGYLQRLREEVYEAIWKGMTKDEAVAAIDLSDNPLFQDPVEKRRERIRANVACVYDEMTLSARD